MRKDGRTLTNNSGSWITGKGGCGSKVKCESSQQKDQERIQLMMFSEIFPDIIFK